MRDRLMMLYEDEETRKPFVIKETVSVGTGAVAWHEETESYMRVEVIGVGTEQYEVAPIDSPNFGVFVVNKEQLFKIPKSLLFPRQVSF